MNGDFPNHIKIAVVDYFLEEDIYAIRDDNGSKMYVYDAFVIDLLSEVLHFSYSIRLDENREVGKRMDNGSWSGVLGMLQRGEVDFAIDALAVTEERTDAIDYSIPYYISDSTFMTHKPEPLSKDSVIFHPFSYHVWIALAAFSLAASFLFYTMKRRTYSFPHILQKVFGSVLEQGLQLDFRSWHKRLVVLAWICGVMFLSYSYKGLLLSFLTFPPMIGVYDIADLSRAVTDSSYECFTFSNSYVIGALKKSGDPAARVIGRSLEENGVAVFDVLKWLKVETPKWAFIDARFDLTRYESVFYISQDSLFTEFLAVGMRKSFCCKKRLDKTIRRIFEAGLTKRFLTERNLKETLKLNNYRWSHEAVNVLTVDDLAGVFQLLIAGLILSCVAFTAELFLLKIF